MGRAELDFHLTKFGYWALEIKSSDTDEWDLNEAIKLVIEKLPKELHVWKSIPHGTKVRLFIGLELAFFNQGFTLEPDILHFLGERSIHIDCDVYAKDE